MGEWGPGFYADGSVSIGSSSNHDASKA